MKSTWAAVMAACAVALLASCGQIRIVDQKESAKPDEPPTVHIEPCAIVERGEMEAAIGMPLESERLQIWDQEYYCEWFSGGAGAALAHRYTAWAEFQVDRRRSTEQELRDTEHEGVEEVPGVGVYAEWLAVEGYGEIEVLTPAGAVIYLRWDAPLAAMTPEFRARVYELARTAVARVDPVFPGEPASLPAASAPAINPCRAIPDDVQRRVLGYSGGMSQRDYQGGPFGGHWFCERGQRLGDGKLDFLGITVMRDPASGKLPAIGEPVPELGPGGWFLPAARANGFVDEPAALGFVGPGGRIVVLNYERPDRDDAWHRAALTELARSVV